MTIGTGGMFPLWFDLGDMKNFFLSIFELSKFISVRHMSYPISIKSFSLIWISFLDALSQLSPFSSSLFYYERASFFLSFLSIEADFLADWTVAVGRPLDKAVAAEEIIEEPPGWEDPSFKKSEPKNVVSSVYEFTIPSSLKRTSLAVASFSLSLTNLQSLKLKILLLCEIRYGKSLMSELFLFAYISEAGLWHPYMNTFFFFEWPWISHASATFLSY